MDSSQNEFYLLQKFQDSLRQSYHEFLAFFQAVVKYELKKVQLIQFSQYMLQIQHHLHILDYLIDNKVTSLTSFEYMILPKMSLEMHKDAFSAQP